MTDKELKSYLENTAFDFDKETVEYLMEEELKKPDEEVNVDFIEACVDYLNDYEETPETPSEETPKKSKEDKSPKKIRGVKALKSFLIAAVILAVTAGATITAASVNVEESADKPLIERINNEFHINLKKADNSAEKYSDKNNKTVEELRQIGFTDVVLPGEILSGDYKCSVANANAEESDGGAEACVKFENRKTNFKGYISLGYREREGVTYAENFCAASLYTVSEQINVNGLDVLIFNDGKERSMIVYSVDNTDYLIVFGNCPLKTALKFAESIK